MKYSAQDLEKIARYEEKRGIKYAKTGGKMYKRVLFFGFVAWLWMMITQLFYILGRAISATAGNTLFDNAFVTILTATSVSVLTVLLYIFRLKIAAFAVNIVAAIVSAISFIGITRVDDSVSSAGSTITEFDQGYFGLKKIFYWRHGIPIFLLIVLFSILIFIILREKHIQKKEYDLISKNNYELQF